MNKEQIEQRQQEILDEIESLEKKRVSALTVVESVFKRQLELKGAYNELNHLKKELL